jgi:hypothetical protein
MVMESMAESAEDIRLNGNFLVKDDDGLQDHLKLLNRLSEKLDAYFALRTIGDYHKRE